MLLKTEERIEQRLETQNTEKTKRKAEKLKTKKLTPICQLTNRGFLVR